MKSNWLRFKTQMLPFLDKEDLKAVEFAQISKEAKVKASDEE